MLVCNDTFIELKNDYEAEEENMGKYNKDFEDHRCRQPHGLHSQQVIASSSPYPSLLSSSPLSSLSPSSLLFIPPLLSPSPRFTLQVCLERLGFTVVDFGAVLSRKNREEMVGGVKKTSRDELFQNVS